MAKAIKHHFWKEMTPEEIRAFNESHEFNLDEMLASIESLMADTLVAAGFPKTLKPPFAPVDVVLRKQIEERGFDWESREGYAVRIMYQTWLVRTSGGRADIAALHALYLGGLLHEAVMHKHWELGFASLQKLAKATDLAWGPLEERIATKEKRRGLFYEEKKKGYNDTEAYKAVASQEGVCAHTIRRAVKGH
jgi:hypothetical protein